MDRGAWWVTVHGVKKSQTWLSNWAINMKDHWSQIIITKIIMKVLKHFENYQESVSVTQSSLTLCSPMEPARLLCPRDSPGKNTGVGRHSLLQGIFPTQGLNLDLLHCRQILYCLSHQGSPIWELPKCDIDTQSEQIPLEKMTPIDLLKAGMPQTFNLLKKKKAISAKWNAIKWDMPIIMKDS